MSKCPWCVGAGSDEDDPGTLCRGHRAEYEGLSIAELDRMETEQYAEFYDSIH